MSYQQRCRPVKDRVFIRLENLHAATSGGVFLPEYAERERTTGRVESVGPEVTSVHPGEQVLFHVFDELPTYDKEVVAVREASILGVFENE